MNRHLRSTEQVKKGIKKTRSRYSINSFWMCTVRRVRSASALALDPQTNERDWWWAGAPGREQSKQERKKWNETVLEEISSTLFLALISEHRRRRPAPPRRYSGRRRSKTDVDNSLSFSFNSLFSLLVTSHTVTSVGPMPRTIPVSESYSR